MEARERSDRRSRIRNRPGSPARGWFATASARSVAVQATMPAFATGPGTAATMVASATQLSETRTRAGRLFRRTVRGTPGEGEERGNDGDQSPIVPPASPRRRPARRAAARRGAQARRDRSRGRGDPRKEGHPGERGSGSCDERPVSSQAREPGRANRSRQQHDRSLHETEPAIGAGRRCGHRLETRRESVRAGDRSGQLGAGAKRDDDFLVRLEDQGCQVSRQPLSGRRRRRVAERPPSSGRRSSATSAARPRRRRTRRE